MTWRPNQTRKRTPAAAAADVAVLGSCVARQEPLDGSRRQDLVETPNTHTKRAAHLKV